MVTGTVEIGFHDWMMDCAEAADFVISFTGDSVAIDRVNCLLNAVVAGLDADILSAAMASPRHPIPFPAIFDSDFVRCRDRKSVV